MQFPSMKAMLWILSIFAVGLLTGVLWNSTSSFDKIDRLNVDISRSLTEIDSLNGELSNLNNSLEKLLSIQVDLNRENSKIIKELDNAGLSRKQKLVLLGRYLTFIDTTLHRIHKPSGATGQ